MTELEGLLRGMTGEKEGFTKAQAIFLRELIDKIDRLEEAHKETQELVVELSRAMDRVSARRE